MNKIDIGTLRHRIEQAFAETVYPGDWCLIGSIESSEPAHVSEAFKGKIDWRTLKPDFLDQAPRGLSTALSFFSDEAFRFYLPAFLIADLEGGLHCVDLTFHLIHGFTDDSKGQLINPARYGKRSWYDHMVYKFSIFDNVQKTVIRDYLQWKIQVGSDPDAELLKQALCNYWAKEAL